MQASTLRPGLLVGLNTSVRGNVSYIKRELEADHAISEQARRARWETERTVANAAEHEAASKVRSEARYAVAKVCAQTAFGYLCPEDRAPELEEAIRAARAMIEAFNASATITRVSLYVITGRVAPDDVEAVRAIRAEVRGLVEEMEKGVSDMTPEKIREAAKRAKEIGSMLSDDGKKRVEDAVDAARRAANAISKATRAGEQAALEVDKAVLAKLASARTSFLDLDEAGEIAEPTADAHALDFEPPQEAAPISAQSYALEF